ncbi:MAG: 2-oxo acid dehydrogenase subunit E2 [Caldilinea sp. CFX5]|nr:2-oxo acid dehydrogenase subunit E2 [Caldilinea sp. CFX5]
MATEVKLPELGEGVEEASISRWLVKEGDTVKAGDPILEVATDKVDTEMPAPVSGKILKINVRENEIATANSVLAIIGAEGESVESAPAPSTNGAAPKAVEKPQTEPTTQWPATPATPPPAEPVADQDVKVTPVAKRIAADRGVSLSGIAGTGPGGQITKEDVLARADGGSAAPAPAETPAAQGLPGDLADVASLEVRRIAADYSLDLKSVAAGRPLSTLTRYDVLNAAAAAGLTEEVEERFLPPQGWMQTTAASAQPAAPAAKASAPAPAAPRPSGGEEVVKPNRMRQLIAKNTFESVQSSPQLTTWHDVDMTAVINHRKANKNQFAAQGVNLTVTAYLIAATVEGLRAVPAANARWADDGIHIYHYYNIGMAASLPVDKYGLGGLIVPVIKNAGDLNLLGIARQVNELAEKARTNKLTGEELSGGTFTVTNYGTSGSVFQTPIIHQGQAGILGTGAIEKRAVVVSNGSPLEANFGDHLAFKPMMTLALTFDHRVLDGATADAFCVAMKKTLENWQ